MPVVDSHICVQVLWLLREVLMRRFLFQRFQIWKKLGCIYTCLRSTLKFVKEMQPEILLKLSEDAQLYLDVCKRYSRCCVGKQQVDCGALTRGTMNSGKRKSRRHLFGSSHSSDAFQRYDELCAMRSLSALLESVSGACHGASRPVSVGSVLRGSTSKPSSVLPRANNRASSSAGHTGPRYTYVDLGDYNQRCYRCEESFWYKRDPPDYIKNLFQNKHFMKNIRAYNQMFAMTSFGAKIDKSINAGRGSYVFKVSGQIYHWIGSMWHFGGADNSHLDTGMVEGLIRFLDAHNELIQLFRTARDKCMQMDIPDFKICLYNVEGVCGYELPTSNTLGAIVFENGITTKKEFDVIIEHKDGLP
uniref:Helitron helicase-like domain-containing protein n=1 Tax=Tanacetum cinerariifolium TaxID=118510 RepID=A0A6L2NYC5_TANCI|nr:helitron helicase-like domain-containing protein [Tanacetum cinerariifolium]